MSHYLVCPSCWEKREKRYREAYCCTHGVHITRDMRRCSECMELTNDDMHCTLPVSKFGPPVDQARLAEPKLDQNVDQDGGERR